MARAVAVDGIESDRVGLLQFNPDGRERTKIYETKCSKTI
jgi:hypothetical protein